MRAAASRSLLSLFVSDMSIHPVQAMTGELPDESVRSESGELNCEVEEEPTRASRAVRSSVLREPPGDK